MKNSAVPPFYFPTMVMFVDDSTDFLFNLSLQLDAMLAFRLYNSASEALRLLNSSSTDVLPEDCFGAYPECERLSLTHQVIDFDLDKIGRAVYNPFRFEQVSVVVVDYYMPEFNGLEFCQSITNPGVRKILLTGRADEKLAVQAFNEGLIDRFIQKQSNGALPALNRAISELQQDYFRQAGRKLVDVLSPRSHVFLRDPAFAGFFQRLCDELGAVEFYLHSVPEGILLFDAKARPSLLIVQTDDDLDAFEMVYGESEENSAPGGKQVRHFWQDRGPHGLALGNWQTCAFPAREFEGRQRYYYAVAHEPPGIDAQTVLSYRSFLEHLDPRGWLGAASLMR